MSVPSTTKQHTLDEIMADFVMYTDPDFLRIEFRNLIDLKSANIIGVKKYQVLFSNINYAWKKVLRYRVYFADFYAQSGKIDEVEALNHHIHAYLQDVDTLKNKIEVFLGALKNDLKKIASNKEEIFDFIDAGIKKTYEVFDAVLKVRNTHVHDGMRYTDGYLLKAENAEHIIQLLSHPEFNAGLNQAHKPVLIAKSEKQKREYFEMAKDHWIKLAENSNHQTSGFLHEFFIGVKPSLYQLLKIKSVKEILKEVKK